MNNNLQLIQSKIYEIRGQKVMLDRDLAELYGIETKVLKQAVKRNLKRFPSDFMFELTQDEFECLRSQFVTSNARGGTRYMPFVFTEQIMRAFVAIRQMIVSSPLDEVAELRAEVKELKEYIEEAFTDYNDINEDTRVQLELINQTLAELQSGKRNLPRPKVGYVK